VALRQEVTLAEVEIIAQVERRRKWTAEEKAALLAEVEAEGGKVSVVALRHRISESVLYNWRAALKSAAAARQVPVATPLTSLIHRISRCQTDNGFGTRPAARRPRQVDPRFSPYLSGARG